MCHAAHTGFKICCWQHLNPLLFRINSSSTCIRALMGKLAQIRRGFPSFPIAQKQNYCRAVNNGNNGHNGIRSLDNSGHYVFEFRYFCPCKACSITTYCFRGVSSILVRPFLRRNHGLKLSLLLSKLLHLLLPTLILHQSSVPPFLILVQGGTNVRHGG